MPPADFAYAPGTDPVGLPLAVSIFADRAHVREELREDVGAAGLLLRECAMMAALLEGAIPDVAGRRVGVVLSGGNVDLARYASLVREGVDAKTR